MILALERMVFSANLLVLVDPKRMPSLPKMSLVFRLWRRKVKYSCFPPPKKDTSIGSFPEKRCFLFLWQHFSIQKIATEEKKPWPFLKTPLKFQSLVVFSTMGLVEIHDPPESWGKGVQERAGPGFLALWKKGPLKGSNQKPCELHGSNWSRSSTQRRSSLAEFLSEKPGPGMLLESNMDVHIYIFIFKS